MKKYTKIGAIILAVVMLLALSVTALADETMDGDGILGSTTQSPALSDTLNIPKTLKVFNPDENTVYAPNITYSYAVTAGSASKVIKDNNNVIAETKAPTAAQLPTLASNTISWSSASTQLGASNTGDNTTANNRQNLVLTFDHTKFTAAGVYRFVITETVDYTGTGVTAGANTDHELFLDVYVKDTDATTAGQYIYGYVLHTTNVGTDEDPLPTGTTKVEGFVYDEYHTSNLRVDKSLVNDAAMNNHEFPMSVSFTNSAVTAGYHILTSSSASGATVSALADKAYADTAASVANGKFIKYIGIPSGESFTVTETNDVTGTTYTVTHKIDTADAVDDGQKVTNETATTGATAMTVDTAHVVLFTNTFTLISPTGVVVRVAPYALLLACGIALLMVTRRRRAEEEA